MHSDGMKTLFRKVRTVDRFPSRLSWASRIRSPPPARGRRGAGPLPCVQGRFQLWGGVYLSCSPGLVGCRLLPAVDSCVVAACGSLCGGMFFVAFIERRLAWVASFFFRGGGPRGGGRGCVGWVDVGADPLRLAFCAWPSSPFPRCSARRLLPSQLRRHPRIPTRPVPRGLRAR